MEEQKSYGRNIQLEQNTKTETLERLLHNKKYRTKKRFTESKSEQKGGFLNQKVNKKEVF